MANLKKIIVQVKTETNCLAYALLLAIATLTNEPNYKAYIQGRKVYPKVSQLLETTCISLHNDGEIPELECFHAHFRQYMIVVYTG